ncbi:hypothetical protein ACMSE3_22605 [Bacteroides thetaiotaomicron]|uniref:hypothetical protein n=1 Tax=Bacteroides thetaiotaomicron TaxID=818 RepID=UPI0039C39E80
MKKILLLMTSIMLLGSIYAQSSKKEDKNRNVLSEFEEMKKKLFRIGKRMGIL